ncbi:helix-turn-helix domain-containing protein [Desulforhopalus singaporensis]|uniref:Helix-turn-helix n=1 Tax=Desulforhopalus singaporensis TaxID=91360 RepID=A0A1H0TGW5_9BACT|nr:helix-turn-helix transcriptional regulator [Desulforhopalus singaporensis]SDP52818.1 Helix-turn-helix [Desulforhopalus singaporensis]
MDSKEFIKTRKELAKTQKELAELLGVSLKAVSSYEQGWRAIPTHVERQLMFLLIRKTCDVENIENCWEIRHCSNEKKAKCPAWEFKSGKLCWFISGTLCENQTQGNWDNKIDICKNCIVLKKLMDHSSR